MSNTNSPSIFTVNAGQLSNSSWVSAFPASIYDEVMNCQSFTLEERLMHDTPLFMFKGRPSEEDQEAVIEFADFHGMAVVLDGRAVTLITDQPRIATLFKLTFGGDA